MSALTPTDGVAASPVMRRSAGAVASAVVAARFLPVWIATGVLAIVAAIIAPEALQSTSWAFVLPYMTILAVAALGQMLVIMQGGIDLSTPAVIATPVQKTALMPRGFCPAHDESASGT